jgi:hypothetical protein
MLASRTMPTLAIARLMLEQRGITKPSRRTWSLVLQSHAAKKALETRIRTQIVEQEVGFEGHGNL